MAKATRKFITYITDPMVLVYPKFETPDVYVDPKTKKAGAPKYKTDAKDLPENSRAIEKAKAFVLKELIKLFPDMDPETRKRTLKNGDTKTVYWPFKTDKDGVETLTSSTGRTYQKDSNENDPLPHHRKGELMRVPMFDAKNQKMPLGVYPGGGTIARQDLTLNEMPNDAGINVYINALQILKLEESSFGKSNFEPTEGYAYGGEDDDADAEPESSFGTATADEADATKF
jgi:hypothetical protein